MPADFERCVDSGGRVRTEKLKGGKYMHVCFKDGKSYAGEVKSKEKLSWTSNFIIEDFPIEEMDHQTQNGGAGKSKKIKGCLMKATESRNNRTYEMDGIVKAEKLAEMPLPVSMNHSEDVSDNVGKITKLISTGDGLDYEGVVYNTAKYPDAVQMMENGLINKISIEADNPLFENKGGKVMVKEFTLMGAGLVKYSGIPQASASIAEALEQNITLKEEVKRMDEQNKLMEEKEKALTEAKAKIASLEADVKSVHEGKVKQLEDSVTALQEEVKTLKEKKPSGVITEVNSASPYKIVEKLSKGDPVAKTFVFEKYQDKGVNFKAFYPANPSEFY